MGQNAEEYHRAYEPISFAVLFGMVEFWRSLGALDRLSPPNFVRKNNAASPGLGGMLDALLDAGNQDLFTARSGLKCLSWRAAPP